MKKTLVFTGSYSQPLLLGTGETVPGEGEGICVLSLDTETGRLNRLSECINQPNPTYLAVDMNKEYLYASYELKEYEGQYGGGCAAYRIDRDKGTVALVNTRITGGTDSCNITVDESNKWVFVANYSSGSVVVYPRNEDGSLGYATCFLQHKGTGPNEFRQECPHCHQVVVDKMHRHLLVNDLGTDEVVIYDVDWDKGHLYPAKTEFPKIEPGAGPRHLAFNEAGDRLYVLSEMGSSINVFSYDSESGQSKHLQRLSTMPEGFAGESSGAAIKMHPNGKLLFNSNRLNDTISVYRVDDKTGMISLLSNQSAGTIKPRDFDITPDGRYLIASGQDTDYLITYSIDEETGGLSEVSKFTGIHAVTCVKIVEYNN